VAHPCLAASSPPTPPRKDTPITTVTIDALDGIELAETLEYFLERLDVLAEHDLATPLLADCSPYDLDDLHTDVTRLHTGPFTT
jgi:hypothetical protein